MPAKPVIAAFDFDGTLIAGDSFIAFARFALPPWRVAWAALLAAPWLVAWKARFITGSAAKERLFGALYKGRSLEWFDRRCAAFAKRLTALECPAAVKALHRQQVSGHRVVVISASIDRWIRPWAEANGVSEVIATQIAVDDRGILTGRFATPNCIGPEKVRRLEAREPHRDSYRLEVWGDSDGDAQLMRIADCAHTVDSNNNTITHSQPS